MRKTSLDMVFELAKRDPRVVFVGSDLGVGTLKEMKAALPERFFMEGIGEQNIIGMAAGLAMDGFIPYVNTIATFLTRRCYEQLATEENSDRSLWICSVFGMSISPSATAMPSAVVELDTSIDLRVSSVQTSLPRRLASVMVSRVSSGVLVCT